jgi:hypothetical protein
MENLKHEKTMKFSLLQINWWITGLLDELVRIHMSRRFNKVRMAQRTSQSIFQRNA